MTGLAIVFTILCLAFGTVYDILCQKERYRSAFWIKGLAGLCFIAVALALTMLQPELAFARLIVFGLVLGLIGDQLLALRRLHQKQHDAFFALGMLAFAAGHVMYILAMWQLDSGAWLFALVLLAFGFSAASWYLMRSSVDAGKLFVPGMTYILLVVSVGSMAAALLLRGQGTRALLLLLGGIAFAVSDCTLTVRSFGPKRTLRQSRIIHATYYTAQLLIAWSIAG